MFDEQGRTWTYVGQTWSPLEVTSSPPARTGATMVWSSARERIVLYAGVRSASVADDVFADMWELAGDRWIEITPEGTIPPVRREPTRS